MAFELLRRLAREIRGGASTAPPHWRAPVMLDQGALGRPGLAMDRRGRGLALWENAGSLWSQPIGPGVPPALMRLPQGDGRAAVLAMNLEGRGVALWSTEEEAETHLLGMMLGAKESPTKTVFTAPGKIHHLQAAVDRRGNVLVVWHQEFRGSFEILALSFDIRAQAWEQEPTRLGPPSTHPLEPRLAVNHREHAMVLWQTDTEEFQGLVACHYLPSERAWSDRPVPVVPRRSALHRVAIDDAGNALALWIHSPHGERSSLESSFYSVRSSQWSEPEILAKAHTFKSLQLAMAGGGEALAAWCQAEHSGTPRLFAKAFQDGAWEKEVERLDPGVGLVLDFAIAIEDQGNAGLLTLQQGPEGHQALVRWREGAWSSPSSLGAPSQTPLSDPHLTLCPLGASALWTLEGGKSRILYASVAERKESRT